MHPCHACNRDLSHLYHYYLHGAEGNRRSKSGSQEPADAAAAAAQEARPEIVVQRLENGRVTWRADLARVADDPESLYLQVWPLLWPGLSWQHAGVQGRNCHHYTHACMESLALCRSCFLRCQGTRGILCMQTCVHSCQGGTRASIVQEHL